MTLTLIVITLSFFLSLTFGLALSFAVFVNPLKKRIFAKIQRKAHWTHKGDAARFGGISILLGVVGTAFILGKEADMGLKILLSASPVFLAGLSEDLGFGLSPIKRILAGCISGLFAVFIFGEWITVTDIPPIDLLLTIPAVAIGLTVVTTCMLCHSVNIVDGLNGLASGAMLIALVGLCLITSSTGGPNTVAIILSLIGSVSAFWIINTISGRLFLGDAGAYMLGHVVGWMAILTMNANEHHSPWSYLLFIVFPISETAVTVARRLLVTQSAFAADRWHMHQLLLEWICSKSDISGKKSNLTASFVLLISSCIPTYIGVVYTESTTICASTALVYFCAFIFCYIKLRQIKMAGQLAA